jgi:MFS family permease
MADEKEVPKSGEISTSEGAGQSLRYPWFVVAVLMVFYVFSFLDRQIITLMVKPIKADLDLNDTQISLLMGFGFAVFYALFGLPIGRMADSMSRKGIIGCGLFVWTLMTAACGTARSFGTLFLFRTGVGVGEAALSPSAYSMITDYFPKEKLGRALSVYAMGVTIGSGMAYFVGGNVIAWANKRGITELPLLGEVKPWQLAFIVIGVAGFIPLILLFVIKEPVRRGVKKIIGADGQEVAARVPIRDVYNFMGTNKKTFICHHSAFALMAFSGYGLAIWCPTLLQRIHGWEVATTGTLLGIRAILSSSLGVIVGGTLSDWWIKKGYKDGPFRVGILSCLIWLPFGILYPIVGNGWWCYGLMNVAFFISSFTTGVGPASLQRIMPNKMRGLSSSLFLMVSSLIGLGLGPTAIGLLNDFVFKDEMMLGYSCVIVGVFAQLGAAYLFYYGKKSYIESVDRLDEWEVANT